MKINPPPNTTFFEVLQACRVLGLEIDFVPIEKPVSSARVRMEGIIYQALGSHMKNHDFLLSVARGLADELDSALRKS